MQNLDVVLGLRKCQDRVFIAGYVHTGKKFSIAFINNFLEKEEKLFV